MNGETVKKGDVKIIPEKDEIALDGKPIKYEKYVYILLNKPFGVVSATEDGRDKTVIDLLPETLKKRNLFPCGRLDKDTVGLVVITDDGESAHAALSPKKHVEKEYYFETADEYDEKDRLAIENGLILRDGYTTKPCKIERKSEKSGVITLTEGKYHEIKRLFGARGNKITFLRRDGFGGIRSDGLNLGEWRYMTDAEVKKFVSRSDAEQE